MKKYTAIAAAILMCLTLVGCTSKADRYTNYIRATLECSYYGIETGYAEAIGITNDEALNLYRDEVAYVTELICYRFAVEPSCISAETQEGYELLAMDVLEKTKFLILPATAASARLIPLAILLRKYLDGLVMDSPTSEAAAKCMIP